MESASAQVIILDDHRPTRGADGISDVQQASVQESHDNQPDRPNDDVSFVNFYPFGESQDSGITEAISLLREGLGRLEQAITSCREDDAIGCDDSLQQIVALLPELFVRAQSIGDGFRAVVLAAFHCVKNANGPFSERQLHELRSGLKKLSLAPYIDFEAALDIQQAYEDAGLEPDSKEVGKLSEFIRKQGEGIC
jgi:hypothetical protein